VKDLRVEVEEAWAEVLRAEDKVDEMTAGMDELRRDFNQYRGWWLTENRSLKLVLRDVPKRKWNAGLQAIASSSYGRYMTYCGNGSN
jgi:predicted methyltransferase